MAQNAACERAHGAVNIMLADADTRLCSGNPVETPNIATVGIVNEEGITAAAPPVGTYPIRARSADGGPPFITSVIHFRYRDGGVTTFKEGSVTLTQQAERVAGSFVARQGSLADGGQGTEWLEGTFDVPSCVVPR